MGERYDEQSSKGCTGDETIKTGAKQAPNHQITILPSATVTGATFSVYGIPPNKVGDDFGWVGPLDTKTITIAGDVFKVDGYVFAKLKIEPNATFKADPATYKWAYNAWGNQ